MEGPTVLNQSGTTGSTTQRHVPEDVNLLLRINFNFVTQSVHEKTLFVRLLQVQTPNTFL